MPNFAPSATPPVSPHDAAWLYFRNGEIWVEGESNAAADAGILHASPDVLCLPAIRTVYLGALDDRPCFAAELEIVPREGRFIALRAALAAVGDDLVGLVSAGAQLVHFEQNHRCCGRCGGILVASHVDRAKRCEACEVDFYPRIAPAAIVLVHDGPRLLLTHVGNRPFWALVAGFLEPGETLEQCAAREVREETGIAIDEIEYFGSQPWPFPSQVMVGFHARYAGGEILVDRTELDEAKWFAHDELPPLPPRLSIARRLIEARAARMKGLQGQR
jgi:NAD+ diphosphatase